MTKFPAGVEVMQGREAGEPENQRLREPLSRSCFYGQAMGSMTTIRLFSALPPLRRLCLAAPAMSLMAALFIAIADALAASGDQPSPAPVTSCVTSDNYVVVSRSGDGPGNDIFARQPSGRSAETCALNWSSEGFRVAKAGEAKSVLALQGKFLILDEGTGPSIRRLLVVDLAKGGEVWSGRYVPEPKPTLSAHGLVFHKYLRTARKNDCRNARKIILQGFTPLYVTKGELFLANLAFRATGQPDCIAGQ
jgi:hypothetical protein